MAENFEVRVGKDQDHDDNEGVTVKKIELYVM